MNSIVYVGMDVHKEQYTLCCNRFIQRCREAYDICSVSSGRD